MEWGWGRGGCLILGWSASREAAACSSKAGCGLELHVGQFVPAGLATASLRGVHDVVGDEEEGLQPLNAPAEYGGSSIVVEIEGALDCTCGFNHGKTAVELTLWHVIVHQPLHVGAGRGAQRVGRTHLCKRIRTLLLSMFCDVHAEWLRVEAVISVVMRAGLAQLAG